MVLVYSQGSLSSVNSLRSLLIGVAFIWAMHSLHAVPIIINDGTSTTAVNDGTINGGEYIGFSMGINNGFGDVIGANSGLYIDSSLAGGLNVGLRGGGGGLNDIGVIYIDSIPGGFADTTTFFDTADNHRMAISGDNGSSTADLTFAPGFLADFAIAFDQDFAGIWQLSSGGSHTFINPANINPTGNPGANMWEMDLNLSDIGLNPGGSFSYVATYINPVVMFRSDEFHGVASFIGGNPGMAPVFLNSGDSNVFNSVAEVDIGLSKSINNPAPSIGETIIYTLTATNSGPSDATGVQVGESLPFLEVTFQSASTPDYNPTNAQWTIGDIPAGSSTSMTISAIVEPAAAGRTPVNFLFMMTVDQPQTNFANDSAFAEFQGPPPPVVTNTIPANTENNVRVSTNILIEVSNPVDQATIDTNTVLVRGDRFGLYPGTFSFPETNVVAFDPAVDFLPGERLDVTMTDFAQAVGGAPIAQHTFQFHAAAQGCNGVGFTDSGQLLESALSGGVSLGDVDGDGDLDAFVSNFGGEGNRVWTNAGSATFSDSGQTPGAPIAGFRPDLGDVDGDGDLDAFVVGSAVGGENRVYTNTGSGLFVDSGQNVIAPNSANVALGDLNGDGSLDSFLCNYGANPNSVFFNFGGGIFIDSGQTLGVGWSWAADLGDVDGDGDLDVVVANELPGDTVWTNDGFGFFADTGQSLGAGSGYGISLGDLNDDGSMDIFDGRFGGNRVWTNDGTGLFTDTGQSLGDPTAPVISVSVGDLDGDGDLDAFAVNQGQPDRFFKNNGAGFFTDGGQLLSSGSSYGFDLGDLDGDGDLDVFTANQGQPNEVWLNQCLFMALTGTTPGNGDLGVPVTNAIVAQFDTPIEPSSINTNSIIVRGQQFGQYPGSYSFPTPNSLRFDPAVDFLFGEEIEVTISTNILGVGGSTLLRPSTFRFSTETFPCVNPMFQNSGQNLGFEYSYEIALGDLDGDGDLDALVANLLSENRVFTNTGTGLFFDTGQLLPANDSYSVDLGDLDGDGDLDGFGANNNGATDLVWFNNGSGQLIDSGQNLGLSDSADVDLGDLDNDGDLDAFVACYNFSANLVWLNNGSGTFTGNGQSLGSSSSYGLSVGDVDGDGDLDAFTANYGNGLGQGNVVWVNNGQAQFSDSGQALGSEPSYAVSLGDLDGDGDLDAFVGNAVTGGDTNRVWANDGTGGFSDTGQGLGDSTSFGVHLGDLDGDGDLDAVVANTDNRANKAWINNGAGTFIDSGQDIGTRSSEDLTLGDVDGDGDLDAFFANHGPGDRANQIWFRNNCGQMVVSLSGSPTNVVGQTATYTIRVDNLGQPVTNTVTVTDIFPPTVTFVSASDTNCVFTNGNLVCDLGVIPAFSNASFTVDVTVNNGGLITNTVTMELAGSHSLQLDDVDVHISQAVFPPFVVTNTTPGHGSVGLPVTNGISVGFNSAVDQGAFNINAFQIRGEQFGLYNGSFSFPAPHIAVFTPDVNFLSGEEIRVTLNTNLQSSLGGPLRAHSFEFHTKSRACADQVLVDSGQDLGSFRSYGVSVGDVDGDGDLDAFVANDSGEGNRLWENDGLGSFSDSGQSLGTVDSKEVILADLDGDGDLDAFVGNGDFGGISDESWENDGSGNFSLRQTLPNSNADTRSLALGDVDGDGDLDAFIGTFLDTNTRIYRNNGSGIFSLDLQSFGHDIVEGAALNDLDSDGDLDLFIGRGGGIPNEVWTNDGFGDFMDTGQRLGGDQTMAIDLGDLDGDGDLDAFEVNGNGTDSRVWTNNGAALFTDSGQLLSEPGFGRDVDLGDIDGDGDLDAFVGYAAGFSTFWRNDGLGGFTDSLQDTGAANERGVELADLDGDGDLDVFTAADGSGNKVWFTQCSVDVGIVKDVVSTNVSPGETVIYMLTVTNLSPGTALGVVITDALPTNVTYGGVDSPDCILTNGNVVCTLGNLAAGATTSLVITATINTAGAITNTASVTSSENDPDPLNNTDEVVIQSQVLEISFSQASFQIREDGTAVGADVTLIRGASSLTSVVDVALSGGSATSGIDYDNTPIQVTFNAGETSKMVNVPIIQDDITELDEDVGLNLTIVTNGAPGTPNTATLTILDDDPASISIADVSRREGDIGVTNFVFEVVLDSAVDTNVTVDFTSLDGTATLGDSDYSTNSGTLNFSGASVETQTVMIAVNGDEAVEVDETFTVKLQNLQAGGRNVILGGEGADNVRLNEDLAFNSDVQAQALSPDGTLAVYTAPQDIQFVTELYSVSSLGGPTTKLNPPFGSGRTISQFIISWDSTRVVYRANQDTSSDFELYSVPILGGVSTKLNGPLVSSGDVISGFQISPDNSRVVYRATQDRATDQELYSVPLTGGPFVKLNDVLVNGGDVSSFQISPDSTRVIYLADQDVDSVNELYSVAITGGPPVKLNLPLVFGRRVESQYTISADSTRVIYRADQDVNDTVELYSVPIAGGVATKLNGPFAVGRDVFSFQVSLDSSQVVYRATQDFSTRAELYSVSILGGAQTKIVSLDNGEAVFQFEITADNSQVVYRGDVDVNGEDELYSVPITGGASVQLNPALVGGGDVTRFELSTDSSLVVYRADQDVDDVFELFSVPVLGGPSTRLSAPPVAGGGVTTTFKLSTDNSHVVYLADQDADEVFEIYRVPIAGGNVTKMNGSLATGGDVINDYLLTDDAGLVVYRADQAADFQNELYSSVYQRAGEGEGTILNDDFPVDLRVMKSASMNNVQVGTGLSYTLTIDNLAVAAAENVVVTDRLPAAVSYLSVSSPDCIFTNGEVVCSLGTIPGLASTSLAIDVSVDVQGTFTNLAEATTTNVDTNLANNVGLSIVNGRYPSVQFSTNIYQVLESGALVNNTLSLTLSPTGLVPAVVQVGFAGGNATPGVDYDSTPIVVTIPPGQNSEPFTVPILQDFVLEAREDIRMVVTVVSNVEIGARSSATLQIYDDDAGSLTVSSVTRAEGNSGTTDFVFDVVLDTAADTNLSVEFSTRDGTATLADSDYNGNSGTLNFSGTAGETQSVTVTVNGDTVVEPDETFDLLLDHVESEGRNLVLGGLSVTNLKLNPLPVSGGGTASGLLSPDESRFVFLGILDSPGVLELYSVASTGGPATKLNAPLVSSGDLLSGFLFSSDGNRVIYHADQDTNDVNELYIVPTLGGSVIKLNGSLAVGGDVFDFQFTADDSRVIYRADQNVNDQFELFSVPSTGGPSVRLNGPLVAGGNIGTQYEVSTDSSNVVYIADQDTNNVNQLYSVPVTGGPPVRLNRALPLGGNVTGFFISSDGNTVVYRADQDTDTVPELYSVPITGGLITKLTTNLVANGGISSFLLSPDGARAVYQADQDTDGVLELYSVPITGGPYVKLSHPIPANTDIGADFIISPDSSRVVYRHVLQGFSLHRRDI